MKRRSFMGAILGAAAAPAIVRAGVLMPVKRPIWTPSELAIYPIPGMVQFVSDYPRYIKHVGVDAFMAPRDVALLGCGELSVLLPHQKLPPGWEYCDAFGVLRPYDDSADRALFERQMQDARSTYAA